MLAPKFLKSTTIRTKRLLMYYLAAMNFMFVYTILAYSIAVFLKERFPDQENAIFFVGLILGTASFFGLFVDGLWTYFQKVKTAKLLFLWSIVGLMATVAIFLFSQFEINLFKPLKWALFTVVAAFLYGWSHDLYEVTTTTYILKRSKPEEFAQNISQKKVFEAVGMLGGLVVGGVALYFGSQVAQVFLLFFLFGSLLFVKHYFDREQDDLGLKFSEGALVNWKEVFQLIAHPNEVATVLDPAEAELKNQVLQLSAKTAEQLQNLPEEQRHKAEEMLNGARSKLIDLLMVAKEIEHQGPQPEWSMRSMMKEVGLVFTDFLHMFSKTTPFALFWVIFAVMFFSFWDTMAITFQPLFLERFASQLGSFGKVLGGGIMALFILPVFALQVPFAKFADKHGHYITILFGIAVSGCSLLMLGLIDSIFSGSITVLLLAGMLNSVGYAAAFSPAQAMFVTEQQRYIKQKTGRIIDSEEGAGPLRFVLNIGNILGQIAGGFVFAFLGFTTGFLLFGIMLIAVALFTIPFLGKLKQKDI